MSDLTESEEYHHQMIVDHNAQFINNEPMQYPEESYAEQQMRKNAERKARLEIIRQNEKETNMALKGKPVDYVRMRDNTDNVLRDRSNFYGL